MTQRTVPKDEFIPQIHGVLYSEYMAQELVPALEPRPSRGLH
jgi:hypothetical protein